MVRGEVWEMVKEHHERQRQERENEKRVLRDRLESVLKGRELIIRI